MIVASCGGVYQRPRLWTGEPVNWNNIARAYRLKIWITFILLLFNLVSSQGRIPCYSLHMAISHTLAFCPRRVAHLCPLRAVGLWRTRSSEGFSRGLEKMQAACHWAPYGTSSRLSPWTWPPLSYAHTHIPPLSPWLEDLLLRAVADRKFEPCTF